MDDNMTYVVPPEIQDIAIADSETSDAQNRLRVSNLLTPIWEIRHTHMRQAFFFNDLTAGAGAIAFNNTTGMVELSVGTASGDKAITQTKRYFPLPPKRSCILYFSCLIGAKKAGVRRRVGYFDDDNGIFVEQDSNGLYLVSRSNVSGSVIDTRIAQADWNKDKLDGTGISGKILNEAYLQTFTMDFSIDSVPRIRVGVEIDGLLYFIHTFSFENITTNVFRTMSLPIRYEIENTAATASASDLKEGFSAVNIEGSPTLPEIIFQRSNTTNRTVGTTRVPIFAVRLKDTFGGNDNRRSAALHNAFFYQDEGDIFFEVALLSNPSAITATWQSADDDSAIEYSEDISAVTGNEVLLSQAWSTAVKNDISGIADLRSIAENFANFINQNYDSSNSDMFVIYATKLDTGTANCRAGIRWLEFE